jgi:formylglycine-generating enzyme required for sulfatase activity
MRRWFLSYNSQDLALMQGLEVALQRREPGDKIFFAPISLRAGGFWLPELAKGIAEATAFVLLVGENGLGAWQVVEYYEALDRRVKQPDFPVILVLLNNRPAPGLPFLRQLHWIITADPASQQSVAQIVNAAAGGGAIPGELWRHTAPYRGLAAMTESDADFFFGRGRETVEVIKALEATPEKLPLLLGNSGVGKSSLAQAGLLAAFARQDWPETAGAAGAWPRAFKESRTWCVLTLKPGSDPVRALVEPFVRIWQFDPTDPRRETRQREWTDSLIRGRGTLRGLLDATEERLQEQGRSKPPAFLLYVDQGEELYVRAAPSQRRRFSQILGEGLADPRLRALMSLRADFFGELQNDEALDNVSHKIEVKPLREAQLREVVSKPATLLGARFEADQLAGDIARRAAEESSNDAGALPLLSYLLDDMWKSKDPKWDGILRLPGSAIELGRVLVDRANAFMAEHPNSEDTLRHIFTLKLATVREDGEPTRRRAFRSEFSDEEWRLVSELADHPNRLLVTAASETGETYAEVAHEAIFRRWDKLGEWIAAEREFLAWRSGLEAARHAWQIAPDVSKNDALLMGLALAQAQSWRTRRGDDLPRLDNEFVHLSVKRERAAQNRWWRMRTALVTLALVILAGLGYEAWSSNRAYLKTESEMLVDQIRPKVLSMSEERALKPKDVFKECTYCPEMVSVPPDHFAMGSSESEKGADKSEFPRHNVTISYRFAVSRYPITFAEWDACFARGGCDYSPGDQHWGRGQQPVLNVDWFHAKQYADWLSRETGKTYKLLSEAEYEYAARAGTEKAYPWGDDIKLNGRAMANCDGCGSKWDDWLTAPAGSFAPNAFGLYDMVGNLFSWVEDCWHVSYSGEAPTDGSSWTTACSSVPTSATTKTYNVVRGGSYINYIDNVRSAARRGYSPQYSVSYIGFRIKRTLVQ